MNVNLYQFQKNAINSLHRIGLHASGSYKETGIPQVVALTAPTGSGKTIICSTFIENVFCGIDDILGRPNAVFIWLSDSPELNEQSKMKIESHCDKLKIGTCITIDESSFDQEMLDDGKIYFINTQKLSKTSNLTKHSDSRQYTIWETIRNTAANKADRLYMVIDEAHRGARESEIGKQQTIMTKFVMGSKEDCLDPLPVVVGMSATIDRFNKLVGNVSSTLHKINVSPADVKDSGLLKDEIIVRYPESESQNNDMAFLQAASDEWKDKCLHWHQYLTEQKYTIFNPVFVIQVQAGTGGALSDTNLDDCLAKIEARTGITLKPGEVVHTFGQTKQAITVNGLEVYYCEPSRISETKNVRIVFFKENLSTGWDCPRAETMMSFRKAKDATYIAQLLGRMVRTPRGRIKVDESLNNVHLFLPYFNKNTVDDVIKELKSPECGNIPTDIKAEGLEGEDLFLTIEPEITITERWEEAEHGKIKELESSEPWPEDKNETESCGKISEVSANDVSTIEERKKPEIDNTTPIFEQKKEQPKTLELETAHVFSRKEVLKAINGMGLLTYDVRTVRTSKSNIKDLYTLARILKDSGLYSKAVDDTKTEVAKMIHDYIVRLENSGTYEDRKTELMQFKMAESVFSALGENIKKDGNHDVFSSTDADIDKKLDIAEARLGGEGIKNTYFKLFGNLDEEIKYKVDIILFSNDSASMTALQLFADNRFKDLKNQYRKRIASLGNERITKRYDDVISANAVISEHNLLLPNGINIKNVSEGKEYFDHLYVDPKTNSARIRLNGWEDLTIEEERKRPDFVCWFRNEPNKSWSLCIPYEMNDETKKAYPDMLVVRREGPDGLAGYVVDVLEPHDSSRKDNLGKAIAFAKYAKANNGLGRIELIRMGKNPMGQRQLVRLDMADAHIQDEVLKAKTNDDIDKLFDRNGYYLS